MRVSLFITCLGDWYYPRMGIAAVKVLERLGCEVDFPAAQTCCGQPMFNNGFTDEARRLAARMIEVFAASEYVVTPSGSCAAMVREHYPTLFEGAAREEALALAAKTYEFSEFLVKVLKPDLRAMGVRWDGSATYHYSCHLRGLHMTDEAVQILKQIDGLEYRQLDKAEQCCGFGGTFATSYPDISGSMVRDKMGCIGATGARAVLCSEPGCSMNIEGACRRAGMEAQFISLAEVIAEGMGLLPRSGRP